jgi:hypothetical protein
VVNLLPKIATLNDDYNNSKKRWSAKRKSSAEEKSSKSKWKK